jgi:5-methylcytosine-specific restriction endonuclease McrA
MDHLIQGAELVPKSISKQRFRRSIFEAWAGCCAYCGNPADTLDHVTPRIQGGSTVKQNLVPACKHCNGKKGALLIWTWWQEQPYWDFDRALRVYAWLTLR